MSNYISNSEKARIKKQIKSLEELINNSTDNKQIQKWKNEIVGLKKRLTYGANPIRDV